MLHNVLQTNPAVFTGFIVSLFAVLSIFGIDWATDSNAANLGSIIAALLPFVSGLVTRQQVFAPATVDAIVEGAASDGEGYTAWSSEV